MTPRSLGAQSKQSKQGKGAFQRSKVEMTDSREEGRQRKGGCRRCSHLGGASNRSSL